MTPASTSYPLPEPNTTGPSRARLMALMREIDAYIQEQSRAQREQDAEVQAAPEVRAA